MKKIVSVLAWCLYLAGLSGTEYFVSSSGSDSDRGTRNSPFKTITRAVSCLKPGDTAVLLPGVYFEFVRFTGAGTKEKPVMIRAEKPGSVIITAADRAIREKRAVWKKVDEKTGLYVVDYKLPQPARVLYDNVDLFPYRNLKELNSFSIDRKGVKYPGPRHGFAADAKNGKLYVRLRQDGKYGNPDPNQHIMAVSPAPNGKFGPRYNLSASDSLACNLSLYRPENGSMHMIVDGIIFETPGRAAISMMASDVTVRNCRFLGCWRGGVERTGNAERITVENCEWHCFPVFDDVKELLSLPEAKKLHEIAWPHKSSFRGAAVPYETGICSKVGKNWIIRGNYIHDCFEGLCSVGYSGVDVRIENNRFSRCIDNAVELEDHGKNILICNNLFEDVFQAISWQPLQGPPWPGPAYIINNCFRRTEPYAKMWKRGSAPLKIGAPRYQWKSKALAGKFTGQNADASRIAVPGGLWVCNNTFIEPRGNLINELNYSHQRVDGIHFCNNIGIFARLRQYPDSWTGGVAVHSDYKNNRFFWKKQIPPLKTLEGQNVKTGEELLPEYKKGDIKSAIKEKSVSVPEVKEKLPEYIGAESILLDKGKI